MRPVGRPGGYSPASHPANVLLQPGRRLDFVVRVRPERLGHRAEVRPRAREQIRLVHELAPQTALAAQDQAVPIGYFAQVAPVEPQPVRPVVHAVHVPAAGHHDPVTGSQHLRTVKMKHISPHNNYNIIINARGFVIMSRYQ